MREYSEWSPLSTRGQLPVEVRWKVADTLANQKVPESAEHWQLEPKMLRYNMWTIHNTNELALKAWGLPQYTVLPARFSEK